MVALSLYFQVHQPYRLSADFDFFSIGTDKPYEDEKGNREILKKVAARCYLPTNELLLSLIKEHKGKFKVAFSISGTALEQFERYEPRVIGSFKALADTGAVEFLAETYYHSLAALFSPEEFRRQVRLHRQRIRELFGVMPRVFRNTELIYSNEIAELVGQLGMTAVLAEGADRILGWRSPNYVYSSVRASQMSVILKNYRLSDDIAFRFSNQSWSEWPLNADKYAGWLHQSLGNGDVIGLFMDYETFGEHQWRESGIFEFLRHLPAAVLKHKEFTFMTPSEVAKKIKPVGEIDVPEPISWADTERDVSAWLGNNMQDAAAASIYALEKDVLATRDSDLIHAWRRLQTSDHFYYMCTKWAEDGDVHTYFSPYESPYDAFIRYANALNQIRWLTDRARDNQRLARRASRLRRSGKPKPNTQPSIGPSPAPHAIAALA